MSKSKAGGSSRSRIADHRKPKNSTRNRSRTISTAGAACGHLILRKLTSIGRKATRWVAGTAPVGIGTHISAVTPSFRAMESSTARSAGVSIHRSSLVMLRLATMAATTIILVPTGIAGAGVSITLLITIMAFITVLAAMDTAAPIMGDMAAGRAAPWDTAVAGTMVAEDFMAAKVASMVVEGFMVAEEAVIINA